MIQQFVVPDVLQQFLASLPSIALENVVWDANVTASVPNIPFNPAAVKRMLAFSKAAYSNEASPLLEYNCWLESLDMTYVAQMTFPRGPGV